MFDRPAKLERLRAAAAEDARRRADLYAKTFGMKVGAAHLVIEEGANALASSPPRLTSAYERETADANAAAAGGVLLRVAIYATFALEPP